jgi:hypothetical protein
MADRAYSVPFQVGLIGLLIHFRMQGLCSTNVKMLNGKLKGIQKEVIHGVFKVTTLAL